MKFLKWCKKIIFKLCGKARWLLLALVLTVAFSFALTYVYDLFPQLDCREDSVKLLEKLGSEGRADYVTDMYLNYIRNLSPEDKGNVFRFVRK